ncbi:MAG: hypothetical protein AB7I38_02825 [Dehalococcoidia bacterium]
MDNEFLDELMATAVNYLSGRISFQQLHTSALDLMPELLDDRRAANFASQIVSAEVEAGEAGAEEREARRWAAVDIAVRGMRTHDIEVDGTARQGISSSARTISLTFDDDITPTRSLQVYA